MPTIVILGLKLPFRALWEKVGVQERPGCSCAETPSSFPYCPYCGIRKVTRKVKVYRSKLTGEETTYRNVESVLSYLHNGKLDLYDTNPRGYTDDPVYIYFTNPSCYLEVTQAEPVNMAAIQEYPFELEDWLRGSLGEELWGSGQFGLWAFVVANTEKAADPPPPPPPPTPSNNSGETRTFIIPLGPVGPV